MIATIRVLGPGAEWVVFNSDTPGSSVAVRREKCWKISSYDKGREAMVHVIDDNMDREEFHVRAPFDKVLDLLAYGTEFHSEPTTPAQRGD